MSPKLDAASRDAASAGLVVLATPWGLLLLPWAELEYQLEDGLEDVLSRINVTTHGGAPSC